MGIKFCPKCGNTEFSIVREGKLPGQPYFHVSPGVYRCDKCGFTSVTFPLAKTKKDLKKFQDKLFKNK